MEVTSLDKLISSLHRSKEYEYTFLKVLERKDRIAFLAYLPEDSYQSIYEHRAIKLRLFLNIMKQIQFENDYIIYRKCYEGEHIGKKTISNYFTNYVTPLWYFHKHEPNKPNAVLHFFQKMTNKRKPIRILLNDDYMETFDFDNGYYRLSSWRNKHFHIQNNLYK